MAKIPDGYKHDKIKSSSDGECFECNKIVTSYFTEKGHMFAVHAKNMCEGFLKRFTSDGTRPVTEAMDEAGKMCGNE